MRVSATLLLSRGTTVAAECPGTASAAQRVQRGRTWIVEVSVAKEDRGFASMDRAKQREIASKGGKAAHQKGTAHEWTSEEAREAGRKGGMASHRRRKEGDEQGMSPDLESPDMGERAGGDDQSELIR